MNEPLLLTISEAARRLSISPRLTERLIAAGELPSVRIRRARRIPMAALVACVASFERSLVDCAAEVE